jgi:hypothetical protein
MKKICLLIALTMVTGCSELSNFLPSSGSTDSSARAKMQSCMLSDAQSRLQAGTLFNDTVYNTAKDLASGCAKKLAMESMGISQQTQSDAVNIINSLKNMSAQ